MIARHGGGGVVEDTLAAALTSDGADTAPTGLRERKREQTRRRIIHASRVASLEVGMERLTIDMIARHADISPRSFFNYFPNKEAAIAGVVPGAVEALDQDELDRLPDDIVDAVVAIVVAVLGRHVDRSNGDLRREVFVRFPELLDEFRSLWKALVRSATTSVAEVLSQRGLPAEHSAVVAPALVAMCVVTLRSRLEVGALDTPDISLAATDIADALRLTASVVVGEH